MDLGWLFWVLACGGVFLTGVSKSGFAGGVGSAAVPMLSLVMDPVQAAALMLPVLICMDALSLRLWWGQHDGMYLRALLPGSLLGIALGGLLANVMPVDGVRLLVGLTAIGFVLDVWLRGDRPLGWGNFGWFWGGLSGFTSFLAHAGGPPLNVYLLSQKMPKARYLATTVYFFSVVNLVKVLPYGLLGQWSPQLLKMSLILAPVAWLGVLAGVWLQARMSEVLFRRMAMWLLFFLGIRLLWDVVG